jgi:hypothetical protein
MHTESIDKKRLRHVVRWKSTDVSEEHTISIFMVEEYAKQENSMKQAANEFDLAYSSTLKLETVCSAETSANFNILHGVISRRIELFKTTSQILNNNKIWHLS